MADLSFLKKNKRPIAILGLGLSGRAVADACLAAEVSFHVWDDNAERREQLKDIYPLKDFGQNLQDYEFLVPAAGIHPDHPILNKAHDEAMQIYSDVDLLLLSAPKAKVIGITGTNGKSTTTALIGHILQQAGINLEIGGNIGRAACSLASLGSDGVYVLEMSSYMLEITANPVADIAVLLNITPDHLEWHKTFEDYTAAKQKIFRQRKGYDPQVKIYGLSMAKTAAEITSLPEHPYLKGKHNEENILAAMEACRACGLEDKTILEHLLTFEGLSHRQKQVAIHEHITFINDSKGTNADATANALASYENIYWILGGMPKSDGIKALVPYHSKIHKAYLIGQASDAFAAELSGKIEHVICGVMAEAVAAAFKDALQDTEQAIILLSPACASFDQYQNFEQRGEDFVTQVHTVLKKEAP